MTGQRCHVCGNTRAKDPSVSFHRIPKDACRRAKWLETLGLCESELKQSTRICSRHFPDANDKKEPSLCLGKPYLAFPMCTRFERSLVIGKRFASPIKQGPRAKRAKDRDEMRLLCFSTPVSIVESRTEPAGSELGMATMTTTGYQLQTAVIGQQLLESDYHVHELPACDEPTNDSCSATINALVLRCLKLKMLN